MDILFRRYHLNVPSFLWSSGDVWRSFYFWWMLSSKRDMPQKFNVRRNMQRAISFLFKYCFKIWAVIKLAKKKVFALNDIRNIGGEMLLWNAVIISIHVMIRVFNQGFKSLIIRSGSNGFKCFVMAFYDDCTLRNALVWSFSYDWFYWSCFKTAWLEIGFLLKVYEIF